MSVNWLSNQSIADKIRYIMIAIGACMAITLVTYWAITQYQEKTSEDQEQVLSLQVNTENIYREYLLLRQTQTQYLASETKQLADSYRISSENLKASVSKTLSEMPDNEAYATLEKIQQVIGEEITEFDNIVAVFGAINVDDDGNPKEASSDVTDIEDQLNALSQGLSSNQMYVAMLKMQRAENEFLDTKSDEALNAFDEAAGEFSELLNTNDINKNQRIALSDAVSAYQSHFSGLVDQVFLAEESRIRLGLLTDSLRDLFRQVQTEMTEYYTSNSEILDRRNSIVIMAYGLWLAIIGITICILVYWFGRDLISRLSGLVQVMRLVNDGDLKVRTQLTNNDELGQVGQTFDSLLDERISDLENIELQNNDLNESIISLIQQVGAIANNKDFTVKVPVAGDVTGAVSDSVNLLVDEVSSVLKEVVNISNYLGQASQVILTDAEKVVGDSGETRNQVEEAMESLEKTTIQMQDVSEQSTLVASWADNTINQTQAAYDAVTKSVKSINNIREIISETEKRIKRLGERSQEITGIVNLINNIAERTHILALNASMHAASAGEAGRGFAVVADEVQRLAENAREATAEISTLVNNIHVETTDTVTIMNKVISQVADGTQLADTAGGLMSETKVNTTELVNAIKQIAEDATAQAQNTTKVRERMLQVEEATRQIDERLGEQKRNSDSMESFSRQLVDAVSVFRLGEQLQKKAKQ